MIGIRGLRVIGVIAARELRSLFLQPLAWVVLTALLFFNGLNFWITTASFNQAGAPSSEIVRFLFSGLLFWLPMLISLPVIAMRLVAEERQTGTLETLLTAPVSENQVAVGKYIAAFLFFAALWLPMLLYVGILDWFTDVDWWSASVGFAGHLLTGGFLLSVAVCASALTRNQIVAAIIGFVAVTTVFLLPLLAGFVVQSELATQFWQHLDLLSAMNEFPRGIVRSSRVVYAVSGVIFFVFSTARLIEASKGQ